MLMQLHANLESFTITSFLFYNVWIEWIFSSVKHCYSIWQYHLLIMFDFVIIILCFSKLQSLDLCHLRRKGQSFRLSKPHVFCLWIEFSFLKRSSYNGPIMWLFLTNEKSLIVWENLKLIYLPPSVAIHASQLFFSEVKRPQS